MRDATLFTERGINFTFWSVAFSPDSPDSYREDQRNLGAKNRVKHTDCFTLILRAVVEATADSSNQIRKHGPDIILVYFLDDGLMGQPPLLFGSFFRQDVALVRLLALDLTRTGNFETLLRS